METENIRVSKKHCGIPPINYVEEQRQLRMDPQHGLQALGEWRGRIRTCQWRIEWRFLKV